MSVHRFTFSVLRCYSHAYEPGTNSDLNFSEHVARRMVRRRLRRWVVSGGVTRSVISYQYQTWWGIEGWLVTAGHVAERAADRA
jgi:hypothetical protein